MSFFVFMILITKKASDFHRMLKSIIDLDLLHPYITNHYIRKHCSPIPVSTSMNNSLKNFSIYLKLNANAFFTFKLCIISLQINYTRIYLLIGGEKSNEKQTICNFYFLRMFITYPTDGLKHTIKFNRTLKKMRDLAF